ncbi:MAG: hypothetical protein M3464_14870 [Chloroflexota bacterium]|nr:hypothetical protein [Chloroflexota bacterium]
MVISLFKPIGPHREVRIEPKSNLPAMCIEYDDPIALYGLRMNRGKIVASRRRRRWNEFRAEHHEVLSGLSTVAAVPTSK